MNFAKTKYVGVAMLIVASLVFAQCGGGTKRSSTGTTPGSAGSAKEGVTMPKGATMPLALAPFQGQIQFPHAVSNFTADKGLFNKVEPILKRAAPALAKAAEGLPKGGKLVIIGHADPIGGKRAAYNYGYARAATIMNYLAKSGVPRSKMMIFSAADNDLQNKSNIKADENHRITFAIKN